MIMLLVITATVSGQGLPQLTVELPDPGEVLGKNGRVYDESYMYEGRIYKTFLYERPANEEKFLKMPYISHSSAFLRIIESISF